MGKIAKGSGYIITDNQPTNFRQLPIVKNPETKEIKETKLTNQLTCGDLHGNALKLIHFMIQEGILELKKEDYKKIVDIYEKDKPIRTDFLTFKQIIQNANWDINKGMLRLIGDILSDRGGGSGNDFFTLTILKILKVKKVPFTILFSNHDAVFFESLIRKIHGSELLDVGQSATLDRMYESIRDKSINAQEIFPLLLEGYFPNLKAIDYVYDEEKTPPTLTLFTHAPNGLEIIENLARDYKIPLPKKNIAHCSAEKIKNIIDKINANFVQDAISGKLLRKIKDELHEMNNLGIDANKEAIPAKFPFQRLIWNRYHKNDPDFEWSDSLKDRTALYYVHGHDQAKHHYSHVIGLDNDAGKHNLFSYPDFFFKNNGVSSKEQLDAKLIERLIILRPLNELIVRIKYQLSPLFKKNLDNLIDSIEKEATLDEEALKNISHYIKLITTHVTLSDTKINELKEDIEKIRLRLIKYPFIHDHIVELNKTFIFEKIKRNRIYNILEGNPQDEKSEFSLFKGKTFKSLFLETLKKTKDQKIKNAYKIAFVELKIAIDLAEINPFNKSHWIEIKKTIHLLNLPNQLELFTALSQKQFSCMFQKIEIALRKINPCPSAVTHLLAALKKHKSACFNNESILRFMKYFIESLSTTEPLMVSFLKNTTTLPPELQKNIKDYVNYKNEEFLQGHKSEEKKALEPTTKIQQRDILFYKKIREELKDLPHDTFYDELNRADLFESIHRLVTDSYDKKSLDNYIQQTGRTIYTEKINKFNNQYKVQFAMQEKLHQLDETQLEDETISQILDYLMNDTQLLLNCIPNEIELDNKIISTILDYHPPISSHGFLLINQLLDRVLRNEKFNLLEEWKKIQNILHLDEFEYVANKVATYNKELEDSKEETFFAHATAQVYMEVEKELIRFGKKSNSQDLKLLSSILDHTHDLKQEISKDKINNLENDMAKIQGKPSMGQKVLGALAVVFGLVIMATSAFTAPFTLGLGFVAGVTTSSAIIMAGMMLMGGSMAVVGGYFFNQQNKLATAIEKVIEATPKIS